MAFITTAQLEEYTGNVETSTLKAVYISAAEDIIKDYLGYDPTSKTYTHYFSGISDYRLYLNAQPITTLTSLTIDDVAQTVSNFILDGESIYNKNFDESFTEGSNNIKVVYIAGYSSLPGVIQLTTLRIAALLMQEANGNIGISGKSFSDNSRSFINYADFKKYLKPLDNLRIVRF
jgi:hypothetical protein